MRPSDLIGLILICFGLQGCQPRACDKFFDAKVPYQLTMQHAPGFPDVVKQVYRSKKCFFTNYSVDGEGKTSKCVSKGELLQNCAGNNLPLKGVYFFDNPGLFNRFIVLDKSRAPDIAIDELGGESLAVSPCVFNVLHFHIVINKKDQEDRWYSKDLMTDLKVRKVYEDKLTNRPSPQEFTASDITVDFTPLR